MMSLATLICPTCNWHAFVLLHWCNDGRGLLQAASNLCNAAVVWLSVLLALRNICTCVLVGVRDTIINLNVCMGAAAVGSAPAASAAASPAIAAVRAWMDATPAQQPGRHALQQQQHQSHTPPSAAPIGTHSALQAVKQRKRRLSVPGLQVRVQFETSMLQMVGCLRMLCARIVKMVLLTVRRTSCWRILFFKVRPAAGSRPWRLQRTAACVRGSSNPQVMTLLCDSLTHLAMTTGSMCSTSVTTNEGQRHYRSTKRGI